MPAPTAHHPEHEALIASFVTEGWSRKDAEFRAYRFRKAYYRCSPAEVLAKREAEIAYRAVCKDGWYPASLAAAAEARRAA